MKRVILVSMMVLASLACFAASAWAKDDSPRCAECGMFASHSYARVLAKVKVDGKNSDVVTCSLDCLFAKLAEWGDKASLKSVSILDYKTGGSKNEKLLNAGDAWFLYDCENIKGSMPTFVAAFASKSAAQETQKTLKGDLLQWADVKAKLVAAHKSK